VYVNSSKALKIRARQVSYLVTKGVEQMPWLLEEHLPLLRQWAELEIIRRAAFAGLVQNGVLRIEDNEVSVKRLVHDHRQIAQTQLMFQRELGMTPLVRMQLGEGKQGELDLVAMMAAHSDAAEPGEPENEPEGEDEEPQSEG
jgi:hypothetical protein